MERQYPQLMRTDLEAQIYTFQDDITEWVLLDRNIQAKEHW